MNAPTAGALAALGTVLCALSPRAARADEPRALGEAAFLAEVEARSPRLRAGAARARAARAAVDVAGVRPNPTLAWEREAVPGLDARDDFFRLALPVELSGRRGLGMQAARAEADAAAADAARDALRLQIAARRAYAAAAAARQRVAALDGGRRRLGELIATLRSRAASGDAAEYDVDRVALELELLDDELTSARRELDAARLALGGLAGAPGTAIDAADDLRVPALDEAADARRGDVDAARHRASAARVEARQGRRGWIPRLELGVGVLRSRAAGADGVGYLATIGGELPIFERGGAAARRADAAAAMWDAEADALAAEAGTDAARARRDADAAIRQVTAFRDGPLRRAAKLTAGAEVMYREGDRTIVELLDALRAERVTQARALALLLEAREAQLDLGLALGRAP